MGEVDWSPASGSMGPWNGVSMGNAGKGKKLRKLSLEETGGSGASSTVPPQDNSDARESGPSPPSPKAAPGRIPRLFPKSSPRHRPFLFGPHHLFCLLTRTAIPLGPRQWITGALITFRMVGSMSCASAGVTTGRPPRGFRKYTWLRWRLKQSGEAWPGMMPWIPR